MTQLFSALFVDYDNVSSELNREGSATATRFSSQPGRWLEAIRSSLPLYPDGDEDGRRIVARRCYATPYRIEKNRQDFTRAGFEVIDCPPLTARLKNSADIYMVIDIIDYVERHPLITEFVILSADADFTPLLNRFRRELKRTVIFSSYNTASAYKNCSDQQLPPSFFSDALNVTVAATRPSELPSEPVPGTIPPDQVPTIGTTPAPPQQIDLQLATVVEDALYEMANARQGLVAFAAAAAILTAKFREAFAGNWAGAGRFTTFLRKLTLSKVRVDWDRQVILVPNFSLNLTAWPPEDSDVLREFLTDIVQLYNVPLFTPAQYTSILQMLADYWRNEDGTIVGAIREVLGRCVEEGIEATQSALRFIVTGVSQHGVEFGPTITVSQMANALRLHVFQVCDEPEWMIERSEIARLVYWIRSEEDGDEIVDEFLSQISAYGNQSEESQMEERQSDPL